MVDHPLGRDEEFQLASELIAAGEEIAGTSAATALGLFLGGPGGAMLGSIAGPVLLRACRYGVDFARRYLGPREKVRVGAAFSFAVQRIEERRINGDAVRDDGFFLSPIEGRADADEILEGVLLTAQREHEEKKVPFLGYLWANVAFEEQIDRSTANHAIRLAQELSYRQLCLLALVRRKDEFELPESAAQSPAGMSWEAWSLWEELDDLGFAKKELVGVPGRLPTNIGSPAALTLWTFGLLLYDLLDLSKIKRDELAKLAALLLEGHEQTH